MSLTITFNAPEIDGIPVALDEVPTLRDTTVTYGVKRVDNDAVVVAAGTAMTDLGGGAYEYTFAEPAAGLYYDYTVRWVLDGVPNFYSDQIGTPGAPAGVVDGRYATYAGLKLLYGEISLTKWASVNGDDAGVIAGAINSAMVKADARVDAGLYNGPYDTPFVGSQSELPTLIKEAANMLAGSLLYEAQGVIDFDPQSGEPQHRLASQRHEANRILARIKTGRVKLFLDDGTLFGDSAVNVPGAGVSDYCLPDCGCNYPYGKLVNYGPWADA